MGGALSALDMGYQIQAIHESAFAHQRQVESEERIVVGVNRFQSPTPPIEKLQTIEREQTERQLERLARVKRERDESAALARCPGWKRSRAELRTRCPQYWSASRRTPRWAKSRTYSERSGENSKSSRRSSPEELMTTTNAGHVRGASRRDAQAGRQSW